MLPVNSCGMSFTRYISEPIDKGAPRWSFRKFNVEAYRSHVWGVEFICGRTKDIVEPLRSVVEALRVGQDDLIPFNVATLGLRVDYFRELVLRDRADGYLLITPPL